MVTPKNTLAPAVTPRPVILSTVAVVILVVNGLQLSGHALKHGAWKNNPTAMNTLWLGLGLSAFAAYLVSGYSHAYRTRGFVAWAGVIVAFAWLFTLQGTTPPPLVFPVFLMLAFGLSMGACLRAVWATKPKHVVRLLFVIIATAWLYAATTWSREGAFKDGWDSTTAIAASCILALLLVCSFIRPMFEISIEPIYHILHKVSHHGPGIKSFPASGPVLVISNHSSLTDPLFVAQTIPRPFTAMMTAKYYRLWYLKPMVKYIFGAIPVPEEAVRHEAPELKVAIEALNAGHCLLIFPEGYLQRKEQPVMRRFGRGVWEVLKARPEIPIVPMWIEGNWGSFFSHKDGPPMTGKKLQFRRPIKISVGNAFRIPKELLENHLQTRFYLMNQVSACRIHAGLEALPKYEVPAGEGEES